MRTSAWPFHTKGVVNSDGWAGQGWPPVQEGPTLLESSATALLQYDRLFTFGLAGLPMVGAQHHAVLERSPLPYLVHQAVAQAAAAQPIVQDIRALLGQAMAVAAAPPSQGSQGPLKARAGGAADAETVPSETVARTAGVLSADLASLATAIQELSKCAQQLSTKMLPLL
jgi:hypothetical protein